MNAEDKFCLDVENLVTKIHELRIVNMGVILALARTVDNAPLENTLAGIAALLQRDFRWMKEENFERK